MRSSSGKLSGETGFRVILMVPRKGYSVSFVTCSSVFCDDGADFTGRVRSRDQAIVVRKHEEAGCELGPSLVQVCGAAAEVRL